MPQRSKYGLGSVTESLIRDAQKTMETRRGIEWMLPRNLTEGWTHAALSAAAEMKRAFPRSAMESLAESAALQSARYFSAANIGMGPSIAKALQKTLDDMDRGIGGQLARIADNAARSFPRTSFMPDLTHLDEATRALERRMNLEASITADWLRISEIATHPYANISSAIEESLAADRVALTLGGSWHDAFGDRFAVEIQEAFVEEAAKDPEQNVIAIAVAAIVRWATESGVRFDANMVVSLVMSLVISLALQPSDEAMTIDMAEQVAEINWHVNRQLERQDRLLEVSITKDVVHGTRMWTRPDSGSKVVGKIAKGTLVIPQNRKGKWIQVAIKADDSPTGRAMTGWMLKKYVSK